MRKVFDRVVLAFAPVVKRTSRRSPEPQVRVRFPAGAPEAEKRFQRFLDPPGCAFQILGRLGRGFPHTAAGFGSRGRTLRGPDGLRPDQGVIAMVSTDDLALPRVPMLRVEITFCQPIPARFTRRELAHRARRLIAEALEVRVMPPRPRHVPGSRLADPRPRGPAMPNYAV